MKRLVLCLLCLLFCAASAHAVSEFVLAWDYIANPDRPGTAFVVQRCEAQGTSCVTPMADVPGGVLPLTTLTWTDRMAYSDVLYCYQVLVSDDFGRSDPSNQACGEISSV